MGFRKLFNKTVENWPAKVISLALAIFLFIFHRMSILETRFFYIPIRIEQLNTLMPSNPYPRMIKVSLKGEGETLYAISEEDIEPFCDMGKIEAPGTYNVPVQWRKKGVALGVEPLQVSVDPMEITFSLDRKISKYVPLDINFAGQLETGYTLTSYSLNPAQVVIEGPQGYMGNVSELSTEPIDLSGRINDFTLTIAVLRRVPLISIRGSGTSVFSATISKMIPVRNILNVPITITDLSENLVGELEIKTVNIRLEGIDHEAIEMFEPEHGFFWVDCSEIEEPGVYSLKVYSRDAEDIVIRTEPEEVRIQIIFAEGDEND